MSKNAVPDVLPVWANQGLMALWLLLFGGRWVLAPVLQFAGLLLPAQLEMLDELVLLKLYLVLLAATCVVAALRTVRTAQSAMSTQRSVSVENASQAGVPLDVTSPGGDEARD